MSDHAYDISYLLDAEAILPERAAPRVAAVPAVPKGPSLAETQEAFARELLQAAAVHEALVQQYLRMYGPMEDNGIR